MYDDDESNTMNKTTMLLKCSLNPQDNTIYLNKLMLCYVIIND